MKYLVLLAVLSMFNGTDLRAEHVSYGDESNPYKRHWSKQYNVIVPEGQASMIRRTTNDVSPKGQCYLT